MPGVFSSHDVQNNRSEAVYSVISRWLLKPWIDVKDFNTERRLSLMAGFLLFYTASFFSGAIITSSRDGALSFLLGASGGTLFLVYILSRTRYYRTAIILSMIVPVLPVFLQILLSSAPVNHLESIFWLTFPILLCALLASIRAMLIVTASYITALLVLVFFGNLSASILDMVIPYLLTIAGLAAAITRVRQQEKEESEYQIKQNMEIQQRMIDQEQFFRSLLDSFSTGVLIVDSRTCLVKDTNVAAATLLQRDKEDILGSGIMDLLYIPDMPLNGTTLEGIDSKVFEGEISGRENSRTPVMVNISELRSANESNIFISLVDNTERKAIEEREKRLQQEIIASSRLASLGGMAAGVAHEINNPLASILLHADLLLDSDITEEHTADIKVINDQVARITKIVSGMLNFARPDQSSGTRLDVNRILEETLEFHGHELKLCNIHVIKRFASPLPPVTANATQLQQVFFNIINNAQKEMAEAHGAGLLTVTTSSGEGTIRVEIADDGRGIDKDSMARMFEPFYTTREIGQGTGLGLSICHGIITSLGGRIWAECGENEGSTFIVELPVSTESDDADECRAIQIINAN